MKSCTHTLWFLLFIIFWIALIILMIYAIIYGNYLAAFNGYDSFGNICGVEINQIYKNVSLSGMDTSDKPNVFYFATSALSNTLKLCVQTCPHERIYIDMDLLAYAKKVGCEYCRYDFDMNKLKTVIGIQFMHRLGPCPKPKVLRSMSVWNRCAPLGPIPPTKEFFSILNSVSDAQLVFLYIYSARYKIVCFSAFSVVLSIVLMIMMHWLPKVITWVIGFLVILSSCGFSAMLWYTYDNLPPEMSEQYSEIWHYDSYENDDEAQMRPPYYFLKHFVINKSIIYVAGVLSSIATVLLLIVTSIMTKHLSRISLFLKEARHCLIKLPELLVAPLTTLLVLIVFCFISIYTMLCMTSSSYVDVVPFIINFKRTEYDYDFGDITDLDDIHKASEQLEYIEINSIRQLFYVYLVGFIWTVEFIFACEEFLLGAAIGYWYFRRPLNSPLMYAIRKLIKHHLETVARRSIAVIFFKIPGLIMTLLCTIIKQSAYLRRLECFKRILDSVESWYAFVDHNIYLTKALGTIIDLSHNARPCNLKVDATNKTAVLILFLGKLFVAFSTSLLSLVTLKSDRNLYFFMAPVILSGILSFYIAHVVLSLYEILMDTLFVCFCIDKQNYPDNERWTQSNLVKLVDTSSTKHDSIHFINVRSINGS